MLKGHLNFALCVAFPPLIWLVREEQAAPEYSGDKLRSRREVREWVLCHERSRSMRLRATVLEMKEGPSGSAIR